tara:strand:+ start:4364 stop:4528 length:165 start_codon:yes stop_codon:yes gene_type:complete
MTWKLKTECEDMSVDSIYKPLKALSQKEIKCLKENLRNKLFEEIKPTKKVNKYV